MDYFAQISAAQTCRVREWVVFVCMKKQYARRAGAGCEMFVMLM